MEHENRLELNRYSKSFVGPSAAQEADSVIVGSDKEKKANTCAATREAKNFMETFIRRNDARVYPKMKSRCASKWHVGLLARSHLIADVKLHRNAVSFWGVFVRDARSRHLSH